MHLTIRLGLITSLSLSSAFALPEGFEIHNFAEPFDADYPAAITVAPNGDVYVSSDQNGSLGKLDGMGRVIRCRDTDDDGTADEFVHFVPDVDSPRGGHIVGDTLYLIHPPYLSSFRDTDGDGVADEKKVLVTGLGGGIEHPRGADHTTNAVRMGIDGWLYITVGDFGTTPARGTDGSEYTLHGGGVIRVRPDGTEIEPYALMTRNTYDTAISPTLDMFSRDNTNDGKGWNTRFHHYTALGDHGYPRLYKNFADEAIVPLADYGGGSGTGALWVDEPGFPRDFGDMLYSCDWTTGNIYYHPHKKVGASFQIEQKVFHKVPRATDIDVDGFARLYIADWRDGKYKYAGEGKKVGMIQQVRVMGGTHTRYYDVAGLSDDELISLLGCASHVQRFAVQREILKRKTPGNFAKGVYALASDPEKSVEARVAAVFTFKQLVPQLAPHFLARLANDSSIREYALRAMTDRKTQLDGVPVELYLNALSDPNPRVVLQALVGLERLDAKSSSSAIIKASTDWSEPGISPRLQHTASAVLTSLADIPSLLAGTESGETRALCYSALRRLHQKEVVNGLIKIHRESDDSDQIYGALTALARLHFREAEWDRASWWRTRPDDRGPYYEPVEWEETPRIRTALEEGFARIPNIQQGEYLAQLAANRIAISTLNLSGLDPVMAALGTPEPTEDQFMLLIDAALDESEHFDLRLKCYQALLRDNPRKIVPRQIEILADWSTEPDLPAAADQTIDDFVNETQRGEQLKPLREVAAKGNVAESTIAWKAILTVTTSPLAKERWQEAAQEMATDNPPEVGFFKALVELKLTGYDQQIEAALNSDNLELMAAAKEAKAIATMASSSGERVSELEPDAVMKYTIDSAGTGDLIEGKRLYTSQGCIACHAVDPNAVQKGPYLGSAGSKFTRDYLIESILDPNAVVAQGFQTTVLTMADGTVLTGFIVNEADGVIEIRNIAGQASKVKRADVTKETSQPQSMMPAGLGATLTLEQFNSMIDFLDSLESEK